MAAHAKEVNCEVGAYGGELDLGKWREWELTGKYKSGLTAITQLQEPCAIAGEFLLSKPETPWRFGRCFDFGHFVAILLHSCEICQEASA